MPAPVLAQLEYELRNEPTGLEPLCRSDTSRTDYVAFLARSYGFHAPFESMARGVAGMDHLIDLKQRLKAGRIAADLLALGVRPAEITGIPLCPTIPSFHSIEELLGWLYVVERTTLGLELAQSRLRQHLPMEIATASSFVSGYGNQTEIRWLEVCDVVTQHGSTAAGATAIVRAAIVASMRRARWIEDNESARRVSA